MKKPKSVPSSTFKINWILLVASTTEREKIHALKSIFKYNEKELFLNVQMTIQNLPW